jgi:hypothetical protein
MWKNMLAQGGDAFIRSQGGPRYALSSFWQGNQGWFRGVWLEELKFNKYRSTFVCFDKKFLILD